MAGQNTYYNLMELMVCVASRQLEDAKTSVIGTGMPLAAAMLAQKTAAPNLIILFEAGSAAPQLERLPISVADSCTQTGALLHSSMDIIMEACQRGTIDYTFLGGAQIDMYGNLNTSIIGTDIQHPKVRLPGSGGANDLASLCWKTLVITPHDSRRFVKKLDFLTTPGYLTGPGARERAGLAPGCGPYKVISTLALMGYDPETKRMRVESLHPGVTKEDVIANTGFEMLFVDPLPTTAEPTGYELKMLREVVDPQGMVIGKGTTRQPREVVDLVEEAIAFYRASGKDIALAEYASPKGRFVQQQLYVFALDLNGIMLAHGINERFAGKSFFNAKDSGGKAFVQEIIEIANTQGSGWVEYKWYHPVTKRDLPKSVYFKKVEDTIVCSGLYREDEDIYLLDLL
jgi:glutaconate CoA-transferase subunit B